MQARHCGHQREPEPVAGRTAAALQPVEPLQYVLALARRYAGSVVGDRNHSGAIAILHDYIDPAGLASVLDGIVDQIADRVEQKIAVAYDEDTVGGSRIEPDAPV